MYEYVKEYRLLEDVTDQYPEDLKRLEQQLKAVIQQHHNALIRNKLVQ